jgi:hypothetical protein
MLWPQDPSGGVPQESIIVGGLGDSPAADSAMLLSTAIFVLGLALVVWLRIDSPQAPTWRSKRITEAARKGAARFSQTRHP